MSENLTILTPPEPPKRLYHVHLFHVVRSTFGVLACDHGDAIRSAMPTFEAVDFSNEQPGVSQGYLATLPTDKIVSILIDENPEKLAEEASLPSREEEEPITSEMQLLHLASALHEIMLEDKADGRFAKIAKDALAASGITVIDEPE